MTKRFDIVLLPGDGVGGEVLAEAVRVLQAVQDGLKDVRLEFRQLEAGAAEFLRSGNPLPSETFEACRAADAVLLGAMGLPDVRWPDGKEVTPQLDLRERLDLYCGVRPVRLYHEADTPLKGLGRGEIDFVIVRESTEGLFSRRLHAGAPESGFVTDELRVTRLATERVCEAAFRIAERRRRRLVCVDKANVLPSMVFFRSVFDDVARRFVNVEASHVYVDAAALFLLQRPETFDVLVTENMFGDVLSDLSAGLVGGMGMAPSADIGDRHAVFQPAHGSAPDIAGKGVANPVAAILSAAMMLEWLGQPETARGAGAIRRAVEAVLVDPGNRTPDLGGTLSTRDMGSRVVETLDLAGTPAGTTGYLSR